MSCFKVRCINAGSNAVVSLTEGRVYTAIPDPKAAKSDSIRIIDDSGESYLYPWDYFIEIDADELDDAEIDEGRVLGSRAAEMKEQLQQHIDALRHAAHDVTDANGAAIEDVADIFANGLDRYPDLDENPDVNYVHGWLVGFAFALKFRSTVEMLGAVECDTAVYERADGEAIARPEGGR